jgi:HlyD family secretion protein
VRCGIVKTNTLSAIIVRHSHWSLCALGAVASCVVALVGCRGSELSDQPETGPANGATRQIVSLGRLEPEGGIIEVSAMPGERLDFLANEVQVGKPVKAGALLGRVGSYALRSAQLAAVETRLGLAKEQRQQELALAEGRVKEAQASNAQAEAKLAEVQAQRAKLENLREAADLAQQDAALIEELRSSDEEILTERQAQRKRNLANRVVREYQAGEAAFAASLKAAEAAAALADENVAFAQASWERAQKIDQTEAIEAERRVAMEALEQSVLRAPKLPGGPTQYTVLKVATKPGGFVTQIPILQLGDLSSMVCVAEVYEADAKEIQKDQKAMIRSSAFTGNFVEGSEKGPGGLEGEVIEVGSLITSPALTNRNPLAPSDRSIVEVVIKIDPHGKHPKMTAEAAGRVGLQVTVEFGEKPPKSEAGRSTIGAGAVAPTAEPATVQSVQ